MLLSLLFKKMLFLFNKEIPKNIPKSLFLFFYYAASLEKKITTKNL